ncbi:glycosyltransferase family 2 protein [Silvibacterium sp.]|uniref:glycosyltransferase family 2 protein n=1 Tax=Silvibacterium sp. TaxID=1964179 RepID=UPI0039E2251D
MSAVIPTRNRPALVCRAVESVLRQTFEDIEAVVVVDGPDEETIAALEAIRDPRVRVLALQEGVGGSEARNVGARAATGQWIALLDDDDEWLPEKIEKQLALAKTLPGPRIVVACQYLDRMGDTELVRPRRFIAPGQKISDFLYSEVSWLGLMEGFPQTSTWLISREFFLEAPFTKGLKRNQDTDWLLRALRLPNVSVALVPEVLSIFYNERKRKRITASMDWQDCRNWAVGSREIFTPKALSSYLAISPMNLAAQDKVPLRERFSLVKDCWQYGAFDVKILWLLFLNGMLYPYLRKVMTPDVRKKVLYYASFRGLRSPRRPSEHNGDEGYSTGIS